jgi:Tfp pilus assembly protein FimT
MKRRQTDRKNERGLTLVEVLVAFFILFVVTLAVLQLLAMAYLVNLGSMTRTEITYKAEQLVELIRLQRWRFANLGAADDATCFPVGANSGKLITPTDCQTVWGPTGANLISPDARYELEYWINNDAVTVRAIPLSSGANRYLGPAKTKVVVYVAQLQ